MNAMENLENKTRKGEYTLCFKVITVIMASPCTDKTLNADNIQIYYPK